jgi:hypothetical protein
VDEAEVREDEVEWLERVSPGGGGAGVFPLSC